MWSGASPNLSIDDTKLANLNTFSAVLLGIFTIAALMGNFLLILAILCSYSLRNTVFYYHILHLATLNLFNACVGNVIKMIYVWSGEWVLGQFMCTFDAFLGELLMIQTLYMLTLLSVDRAIAMMSVYRYECRLTKLRTSLAIIGCWIIGISMSAPVLFNGLHSEPIPPRFLCAVVKPPVGYPLVALSVCFVAPLCAVLWALGVILWKIHTETIKPKMPDRDGSNTADFIVIVRMAQEQVDLSKYCVFIFCLYFVMQGPYFVFVLFMQIRNSRELENDIGSVVRPPPDAETCLTLWYGLYVVVSPLITMCYVKETWKKIKTWFCCRKYNFIHDGNNGNRNPVNSDCTLKTLKTYENIVKIVPLSAGIHQIRPGHDEPEYADVPISGNSDYNRSLGENDCNYHRYREEKQNDDLENRHNQPITDGRTAGTSDYGSDGSATVDEILHRRNDAMKTQNVETTEDQQKISGIANAIVHTLSTHGSNVEEFRTTDQQATDQ